MIRPKIPLVQNGQRLTSDLVNSMIHRTEYAADLLRQYRLTAGTEMYVEPHYDGTRVSYLQPVGGGQILPPPPPTISKNFRVVFGNTFIYDPFTDTYTTLPGTIAGDRYEAIRGNVVAGFNTSVPNAGIIYNGTSFVRVNFGVDDPYTRFYGTDGKSVVGEYYYPEGSLGSVYGIQCDLNGQKIQDVIYPKSTPFGVYDSQIMFLADVYNNNIIGEVILRNTLGFPQFKYSFIFNGDFIVLDSAVGQNPSFQPYKIYKDYIISYDGKIYSISAGAVIKTILYQGLPVQVYGLYENIVSCSLTFSPFTSFLYYIDTDKFESVNYDGDIG
jgi:hypothetical protein